MVPDSIATSTTTAPVKPRSFLEGISDIFGSAAQAAGPIISAINAPKIAAANNKATYAAQPTGTGFSWSTLSTPAKAGIIGGAALVVLIVVKMVFGKK